MLHDDHTWKYAPCVRHGLQAISLERSLVLAGESADEYRAHLARFDRLVEGMAPGPASDPAKLARATALAAWRRLRALRLDREWTLRALTDVLRQAIRAREEAGKGAAPPAFTPDPAFDSLARKLAADGLGYLGPDPLLRLGLGLEAASSSWVGTWRSLTRLNNRFDQLWCALVELLGEAPPSLPSDVCWERGRMQPSSIVENYTRWPVEVLGNPLRSATAVMASLADRGVSVKPVWRWNFHPGFPSLEEAENYRWRQGEQRRQAERERLEEEKLTAAGDPHYCLLGRARRAEFVTDHRHSEPLRSSAALRQAQGPEQSRGANGPERSEGAQGRLRGEPCSVSGEVLPETFEEFLALVERAFGPEPPLVQRLDTEAHNGSLAGAEGPRGSPENLPNSAEPLPDHPSPSPVEEGPGAVPPSQGSDSNESDPERVRHLAELLWQRVERVRGRAETERRRLAQLVDAYGDALDRRRESDARQETAVNTQEREVGSQETGGSASIPQGRRGGETRSSNLERQEGEVLPSGACPLASDSCLPGALAAEILENFREKGSGKLRKSGNERPIRLAIYDLAAARFGQQPDLELLRQHYDRFEQLHHEFFEIFFSQFHPESPDAGGG